MTGLSTLCYIEKDGKYYGFQSKFYTNSIAENKDDIIDSIKKAKSKLDNCKALAKIIGTITAAEYITNTC